MRRHRPRRPPGRGPNVLGITLGVAGLALALLLAALVLVPSVRETVLSPFVAAPPTAVAAKPAANRRRDQPAGSHARHAHGAGDHGDAAAGDGDRRASDADASAPVTPSVAPTLRPEERLAQARGVADAGNYRAALDILDGLSQSNPTLAGLDDARYDIHMAFAKALLDQNNHDGSYAEYAEALKVRPNDAAAVEGQKQIVLAKNYAIMEANWDKDDEAAIRALEDELASRSELPRHPPEAVRPADRQGRPADRTPASATRRSRC